MTNIGIVHLQPLNGGHKKAEIRLKVNLQRLAENGWPISVSSFSGSRFQSTAALRGDRGVKQRYDRGADRLSRGSAILVHSCGDCGAVVKQEQLSTNLLRVGCTGCLSKVGKQGPKPGTVLLGDDFARIAGPRLRGGADESASAKRRACQQTFNLGEHGEEALSWRRMRGQNVGD